MKNIGLLISIFVSLIGFCQVAPTDYTCSELDKTLNDTINKYYSVTSHQLKQVSGIEIIDSTLLRLWKTSNSNAYQLSVTGKNELSVLFNREKAGDVNYDGFSFTWAGWGKKALSAMPRIGLYPFPYKVGGTTLFPLVEHVDAIKQDTLCGYAAYLHDLPIVRMKVRCTQPTHIRIDLIDKNGRVSNVVAPRQRIITPNRDTILEFRWDNRPHTDIGTITWAYEEFLTDQYNVGVAADGWYGGQDTAFFKTIRQPELWWGVDAGRYADTVPFLSGKKAWEGAVVLDLNNIIGISISLEDGVITQEHINGSEYDYGYDPTAKKTLTVQELIVGDSSRYVSLTRDVLQTNSADARAYKIVSLSSNKLYIGEQTTLKITTNSKLPEVNHVVVRMSNAHTYYYADSIKSINDSSVWASFNLPNSSTSLGEYKLEVYAANKSLNTYVTVEENPLYAPVFKSINPISAKQGQLHRLVATVSNAKFTQSSPYGITVRNGLYSVFGTNINVIDDETFSFDAQLNTIDGAFDLEFYFFKNLRTYSITAPKVFTVIEQILPKPTVTSILPASVKQGEQLMVTLTVENGDFLKNAPYYVAFQQASSTVFTSYSPSVINNKTLQFTVSPLDAPAGVYDVYFTYDLNGYKPTEVLGKSLLMVKETVLPTPEVISISPISAKQGDTIRMLIKVKNGNFNTAAPNIVTFKKDSTSIFYSSYIDTKITDNETISVFVSIRDVIAGKYSVEFSYRQNGFKLREFVLDSAFTVQETVLPQPTITSISPAVLKQGERQIISLTVKNANFTKSAPYTITFADANYDYFNSEYITVIDDEHLVFWVLPGDITPGLYTPQFDYYQNNLKYRSVSKKDLLTVEEQILPVPVIKRALQDSVQIAQRLLLTFVVANANFTKHAPNSVILRKNEYDSGDWAYVDSVINDSTIRVELSNPTKGTFGLWIDYYQNNFKHRQLYADSIITIVGLSKPEIASITPQNFRLGIDSSVIIKVKNAYFKTSAPYLIKFTPNTGSYFYGTNVTVIDDETISVLMTSTNGVGTYGIEFSYYQNNYEYVTLNAKDSISFKIEKDFVFKQITPAQATQGQLLDVKITINGAFFTKSAPNSIRFINELNDSFSSFSVSVIDNETVNARIFVPWGAKAGVYDVVMSYYFYENITIRCPKTFTISETPNKPILLSITPNSATQSDTVQVTLLTKYTRFKVLPTNINRYLVFTSTNGYSFMAWSKAILTDTTILFEIKTSQYTQPGSYSVVLQEEMNFSSSISPYQYPCLNEAFNIIPNNQLPHLVRLDKQYVTQGDSLQIIITGYNFDFLANNNCSVYFQQSSNSIVTHQNQKMFFASKCTALSKDQLVATIFVPRMANVGYYDIILTSNFDTYTLQRGLVVQENSNRPRLISISEQSVRQGDTLDATFIGKDIHFARVLSKTIVSLNSSSGSSEFFDVQVIDDNTITAKVIIPVNMPLGLSTVKLAYAPIGFTATDLRLEYYSLNDAVLIEPATKVGQEVVSNNDDITHVASYITPTLTTGVFTIVAPINSQVLIIGAQGNIITSIASTFSGRTDVDVSSVAAGIYKIYIDTHDQIQSFTLIKQ